MGNQNETDNMELCEDSKDSVASVDTMTDEPKATTYPKKNVARACPPPSQCKCGALKVGFLHEFAGRSDY
ncbi:hypothetical protein A1O3_00055 [Capronia epimyces CBS 606.96]|uniref:Uncharacterized protein n=1 Tax=Capronia epimyces CBS 606.96 TaxID=1182542 RepID=W9YF51_9EURO|nr:uncharacterized protein A1O3_00055 [Capronia epimyces CBS 606.96]EXJ91507.1 hypothetical protein A1O3_00055 [Capronia epimyces CBS 606.96]